MMARSGEASFGQGRAPSDSNDKFVECGTKTVCCRLIDGDLVVATSDVLHECMTSGESASRSESLESAHRSKPRFESAMVGLNWVVRILGGMHRARDHLVENRGYAAARSVVTSTGTVPAERA